MPQHIRAEQLDIDEFQRRVPDGDCRCPMDRPAVNSQRVLNDRADSHVDVTGREDFKPQQRWCQRFEISRVGVVPREEIVKLMQMK